MTKIRMQTANERQVGGSHYRRGDAKTQHWDMMIAARAGYFAGVITKYVERHRYKNGKEDLSKSVHYAEKWVEAGGSKSQLGWRERMRVRDLIAAYAVDAGLTALQERIFERALLEPHHPEKTLDLCRTHLEREYPSTPESSESDNWTRPVPVVTFGETPSAQETMRKDLLTRWSAKEPDRPGTPEDGGHHSKAEPEEERTDDFGRGLEEDLVELLEQDRQNGGL